MSTPTAFSPIRSSRLSSLAFAAAMIAATPAAFATSVDLAPTGPFSFAGAVTQAANGLVIDDFSFSAVPFASTFSVSLTSLTGPVTFFSGSFFPDTPDEIDFSNLTNDVGGDFGFGAPIAAGTPVTLRVFGAVTDATGNLGGDGSYRLSVTAAVPEPATVALMLAGLGVVGFRRAPAPCLKGRPAPRAGSCAAKPVCQRRAEVNKSQTARHLITPSEEGSFLSFVHRATTFAG